MAISAIAGKQGHGKSYSAVQSVILPACAEGRPVITNIPLKIDLIYADYPKAQIYQVELTDKIANDPEFWKFIPGALVVLDELWKMWPTGLPATKIPLCQMEFIREHRHRTDEKGRWQDICLVTQSLDDLCSHITKTVETTIICDQLQDLGATNTFVRSYYKGAQLKLKVPKSVEPITNERLKYDPAIYKYYKSATKAVNDSAAIGGEKVVNKTIFKGWKFKAAAGILASIAVFFVFGINKTSTGIEKIKQNSNLSDKGQKINTPSSGPSVQTVEAPPPILPTESTRWRVTGYYEIPSQGRVVTLSDGNKTRSISFYPACKDELGQMVCQIDNEIIAPWTGADRGMIASYSNTFKPVNLQK